MCTCCGAHHRSILFFSSREFFEMSRPLEVLLSALPSDIADRHHGGKSYFDSVSFTGRFTCWYCCYRLADNTIPLPMTSAGVCPELFFNTLFQDSRKRKFSTIISRYKYFLLWVSFFACIACNCRSAWPLLPFFFRTEMFKRRGCSCHKGYSQEITHSSKGGRMSHAFSHLSAPSPYPTPHTDSDTHINYVNIYTFTHIREHTNSYIYVKHFCAFMNICSYARAHTRLSTHPHTHKKERWW